MQALALLSQPANAPAALKLLTQLLDTIWYAAGDTATDSSWYTKRAALASVYLSTELYMLTDYSPGYAGKPSPLIYTLLDRVIMTLLIVHAFCNSCVIPMLGHWRTLDDRGLISRIPQVREVV
jgi:ubiquinone biosynthesis protein COQ9